MSIKSDKNDIREVDDESKNYEIKTYKRRYAVAASIVLLNLANSCIWVAYAPVATTVEKFYDVDVQKVNMFSIVYLIFTIPFSFIAPYCYDKLGLRVGIYFGASVNCAGSIIKAIGTSNMIDDKDVQYWISLAGQIFCAISQAFILYVPTKVSQLWFPVSERALATTVIAMANPLGVVLAQGSIPSIVNNNESNIPLNNYIWMGFSIFCWALILVTVTRSKPKTPPSFSAQQEVTTPYLQQLKSVFTSVPYLILFMALGCGIGLFSTVATVTQQVLCPLGYSDVFSGATVAVMIFVGFLGAGFLGYLAVKTKNFGDISKISYGIAVIALIFLIEFFLVPDREALIIIFSIIFGFVGVGSYPVGLELAVEVTYPTEESISTAFIFLSGQIQGLIGIVIIPALATIQDSSQAYLNACSGPTIDSAKNYAIPLMIIMSYTTIVICVMILFMKPKYKRMEAESKQEKQQQQNRSQLQNEA